MIQNGNFAKASTTLFRSDNALAKKGANLNHFERCQAQIL